jgi:hypothetical protein
MRGGVEIRLGPGDRERLEAVVADRNISIAISASTTANPDHSSGPFRMNRSMTLKAPQNLPNRSSGENLTFGTLANRSKPAETQASSRYHPLRSHH